MATHLATAAWADPALVEETYRYHDGDVWLGRSASDRQLPIGYHDDRHVCLVSGSRAGKGTSSIINNLCLWPGSVVVVDPKGENATVTAPRRGKGSPNCDGMGQAVHILDPFKAAQVDDSYRSRFNPLDALDPENEESADEAGRIADAIVVMHEDSKDPFWDESARAMVKGLILHVVTDPAYEGRRNLVTLRKLIMRGDWESVEALRASGEQDIGPAQGLLWMQVARNPAFDGLVAGIGDMFSDMLLSSPKQFESVLQVANRNTEFIDSPAMQRLLESSDFELSDLKTRREGMSLYLCLPQRFMNTHYRWLRMMIALTVTEMEIVRARPASGFPVLMLLDEFAGLRRMEVIEHAVAQIAGYGVKLFFVLQTLEQLKAVYKDNWETFLSNSGLKVFFSLDDHFSREYVSKLVGETEIIREVRSASESLSESESESASASKSQSESEGESSSIGRSVSEGTNRSVSRSKSHGVNRSRTSGGTASRSSTEGSSWSAGGGGSSSSRTRGESWSVSNTHGTSDSWSESDSEGSSRGSSESWTQGLSRTLGRSVSETFGRTHGTTRGQTTGTAETVHRRALVTPDEIGHLFARISNPRDHGYPGLALVLISGERTIVLRRVNYFEDYEFVRKFEPHPDFPALPPWKELTLECAALHRYHKVLEYADAITSEATVSSVVAKGQILSAGDPVVQIEYRNRSFAVRMPYKGVITKFPEGSKIAWLFSLLYMDTGEPAADPLSDFAAFTREFAAGVAAKAAKAARVMWVMAALGLLLAIGTVAAGHAALLVLVAPAAVYGFRKAAERRKCDALVASCAELLRGGAQSYWRKQNAPAESGANNLAEAAPQEAAEPQIVAPASVAEPPPAEIPVASAETESTPIDAGESRPESAVAAPEPVDQALTAAKPGESGTENAPVETAAREAEPQETSAAASLAASPAIAEAAETGVLPAEQQVAPAQVREPSAVPAPGAGVRGNEATDRRMALFGGIAIAAIVLIVVVAFAFKGLERSEQPVTVRSSKTSLAKFGWPEASRAAGVRAPSRSSSVNSKPRPATFPVEIEPVRTIREGFGFGLAFSPDGRMLAFGNNRDAVVLWDLAAGSDSCTLAGNPESVAFSRDGTLIASSDFGALVTLWDPATCERLRTFQGSQKGVKAVAFSADSRLLAAGQYDGTIEVWDVKSGSAVNKIVASQNHSVDKVAFSPDGRVLASSSVGSIKLWDADSGAPLHEMSVPSASYSSIAFSPDGRLVAAPAGRTIRIWDASTGKEVRTLVGHRFAVVTVAFSPDGRLLASGGNDYAIKVWDVASGVELKTLSGHKNWVGQLSFSPDGRLLASGSGDGTVKLWRVSEGK